MFQEVQDGTERQTLGMLKTALRFLLLRFLPRRLVPLLTVIEIVRLIRRVRGGRSAPVAGPPRRLRTVGDGHGQRTADGVGASAPDVTRPGS